MLTEKKIKLFYERYKYIPETGQLINIKTGKENKGASAGGRYKSVMIDGLRIYVHKLVWMMHNNWVEPDGVIDHINRDSLDNRIENLRVVSQSENMVNRSNASKYGKWIRFANNKYRVEFSYNGVCQYKSFDTLEEAEKYREEVNIKMSNGTYALIPPENSQLPLGIYRKKSKTQALPYLVSNGIKKDESFLTLEEAIEYLNK